MILFPSSFLSLSRARALLPFSLLPSSFPSVARAFPLLSTLSPTHCPLFSSQSPTQASTTTNKKAKPSGNVACNAPLSSPRWWVGEDGERNCSSKNWLTRLRSWMPNSPTRPGWPVTCGTSCGGWRKQVGTPCPMGWKRRTVNEQRGKSCMYSVLPLVDETVGCMECILRERRGCVGCS